MGWFDQVVAWTVDASATVWDFLNSQLVLTAISTLVAAAMGVIGAQWVIERNRRKEVILREIRRTNAAIVVAAQICSATLAAKKQFAKGLKENFEIAKKNFLQHPARIQGGVVDVHMELKRLEPMDLPIDILKKQVFEEITSPGRVLAVVTALSRSITSLNDQLTMRNNIIAEFQTRRGHSHLDVICDYLGLAHADGNVDSRYADTVSAIAATTDDTIFFSHLITTDLTEHGKEIRKPLGRNPPKITHVEFDVAELKGLMPDPNNYKDWLTNFKKEK